MADISTFRDEPWLTQSLSVGETTILAAGEVRNVRAIDPEAMRILGSFGFIYMVNVDGYYVDELGHACDLQSGDVVWIQPNIAHAYGPKKGRQWTQIYVVLAGAQWEQWAKAGILDSKRPVTRATPVEFWRERLHATFPSDPAPTPAAAMRTLGGTLQVMLDLLAAESESRESPDEAWLVRSQRLLSGRLGERSPTPQAVAREVGLSYESFRKKFGERTGESPGRYQKRRRIEQACAAIYQGSHSFKGLADELGFCDVFHFSKTFRQVVGETPSDFRRRARGE